MSLNRIKSLCKKECMSIAFNPVTLFAGLIFYAAAVIPFFFIQPFFIEGRGSPDLRPFFIFLPYLCAFIVPVLTMNAASENTFFYSLPFTLPEIIAAKWLSSFFYMVLYLLPTITVPVITSFFANIDVGQVVTAYIGIIFFSATACAAGICFAFVTKNHLVAYLITASVLFFSAIIHFLPLYMSLPEWIITSINFLSFAWHFDAASKGIVDTRDLLFYVASTLIFLGFAIYCSKKYQYEGIFIQKVQKIIHIKILYRLFFLFCLLLALNAQRYYMRFDFSSSKIFSLSDQTNILLKKIPDRLHITYYVSSALKNIYPQTRDIGDFLSSYARTSRSVGITVIDPQMVGIEKMLESIGVLPQQIQSSEQNQTSFTTVYSAIMLEYAGKTAQIPFILSTAGLEYDLNIRIEYLTEGISRSVYILPAGKNFNDQFKYVVPWLESSGFTCLMIEPPALPLLDRSFPLLVIDSENLSENDVFEIERFVLEGGAAAFAVSPFSVQISGDWSVTSLPRSSLLNLLDFWGFSIDNSLVLDSVNYRITMQASSENRLFEYVDYPFWIRVLPLNMNKKSAISASFYGLYTYWASPIFIAPDKSPIPLVKTSPRAWLLKPSEQESLFVTDPFIQQKPDDKTLGQYTLAAVSEGPLASYYDQANFAQKSGRVSVVANQYFCSNMIEYTNSPQNIDFLTSLLLWISGDDNLLALRSKGQIPLGLTKVSSTEELVSAKKKTGITLFVIPASIAILYGVFIIKRRKHR